MNRFGFTLKNMLFDNKKGNDGMNIKSITDIYEYAQQLTGLDIKSFVVELYSKDFKFLGYDTNKIENNLIL